MTTRKDNKKFIIDIGWVLLGNFSLVIVTFLQRLFIARFMGAEELGAYSLMMSVYTLGTAVISFGLPMAITKYAAEVKNADQKLRELSSAALIISGFLGIIAACLFPLFSSRLSAILNISQFNDVVILLSLIFPFSTLFYASLALLNGKREMKSYSIFQIIQNILFLLITVFFLMLDLGLKGILLALWISVAMSLIFLIVKHNLFYSLFKNQNLRYNTKRFLKFGIKVLLTDIVNQANNYADFIILGLFVLPAKVGYYTIAISVARLISIIPAGVQKITYPAASEYWANNDNIKLNEMVNQSIKYCSAIAIVLGLGISFFARGIITIIFGEGYEEALIPMLVLIFGVVLNSALVQSVGGLLTAIGRPELSLKIDSVTVVLNLVANIILIPSYGLLGAAIAKSITLVSNTIIKILFFFKIAQLKLELKPFYFISIGVVPLIFIKLILNTFIWGIIILTVYTFIVFKLYFYNENKKLIRALLNPEP